MTEKEGTDNEMKKIILILLAMSILLYGVAALAENSSKLGNLGAPKEETESEETVPSEGMETEPSGGMEAEPSGAVGAVPSEAVGGQG